MTRILGLLLSTLILAGLVAPRAQAAGLPIVISATVDYTHKTVTITGQNFGGIKRSVSCIAGIPLH